MSGNWNWPPVRVFEFQFDKQINIEWNTDLNFDVHVDVDKYVDVDIDVDLDIEDNSTGPSVIDIQDLRTAGAVPNGLIAFSSVSVEDTSSVVQLQFDTNIYDIIAQASATGTQVNTFAELDMNLLIPATGGFHFAALGVTAVDD